MAFLASDQARNRAENAGNVCDWWQSMRDPEVVMSNYRHETVPTRFVENGAIRYAYRRFGRLGGPPLLFLGYFNSNMDGWDPAVTNSLAADHEVILFDNAGVGLRDEKRTKLSLR